MIRSIAGSIARPLAVAITGASGGAAPAPADAYAANSFSPDYVADFSAATNDYFRVAGVDSDFETAFTADSEGGNLATMVDSSGNLVWRPHNLVSDNSADPSTWTTNGTTESAGVVTATAGSGGHHISASRASVTGPHTVTLAVNITEGSHKFFYLFTGTTNSSQRGSVVFDLDQSTYTESSTGASVSVVSGTVTDNADGTKTLRAVLDFASASGSSSGLVLGFAEAATGNTFANNRVTYTAAGTETVTVNAGWWIRTDLGGMAPNPDRTTDTDYVPTTTAARYLARRRHHRYNGTSYVPTLLHEPVGATNLATKSNDIAGWGSVVGLASRTNANFDGPYANALTTVVIDSANSAHRAADGGFTITAGQTVSYSLIVSKSSTPSHVSVYHGSPAAARAYSVVRISDGVVTEEGVSSATAGASHVATYVENQDTDWRITVVGTLGSAETSFFPAFAFVNSATPGVAAPTFTGNGTDTLYLGLADVVAGQSVPSSHIPTTGASVTRSADTCKVKAAALPYDATNMSFAWEGRVSIPSSGIGALFSRYASVANRVLFQVDNGLARGIINTFAFNAGANPSAGPMVSGAAAMRVVDNTAQQSAWNGAAGTEQSSPSPINDFSAADLRFGDGGTGVDLINQEVDVLTIWADDIATAGIESGSASVEIQGVPTISGTEAVGSTLTASAATVVGGPSPSTTWQWQRSANGTSGWADISGATSSTYTLVSADENEYVRAVQTTSVTAGGDTYTDSAESAASGQIAGALPLDTVTSAVLAFSVARKLRTDYTGSAIRVRRSSDDAEQNIGFDAVGFLDEDALTTFCGAGDGFVVTVYEQSGATAAVDLTQTTAANQMQIVSSGSVLKQGGKPYMQRVDTGDFLEAAASWATRPSEAYQCVVAQQTATVTFMTAGTDSGARYSFIGENGNAATQATQAPAALYVDGALVDVRANLDRNDVHDAIALGVPVIVRDHNKDFSTTAWDAYRTAYSTASSFPAFVNEAERIIITDSAQVAALEADQAAFYGITI